MTWRAERYDSTRNTHTLPQRAREGEKEEGEKENEKKIERER